MLDISLELEVVKNKAETLEVQFGTITAEVVKLKDDVVGHQQEHIVAINHIGTGIDRIMAHLNIS